ncbi:hypothetical protein ABT58_05035 [Photobacterium aphoticum]|uniref:YtxH domain-containing protein n=2 Tax=Photobacterium aphoticum TaxID=754436 RepID=A0A0J1GR45_9GAMM|nr:hypothetical protein ABT58_05035 [Photobacterium aphoticum]
MAHPHHPYMGGHPHHPYMHSQMHPQMHPHMMQGGYPHPWMGHPHMHGPMHAQMHSQMHPHMMQGGYPHPWMGHPHMHGPMHAQMHSQMHQHGVPHEDDHDASDAMFEQAQAMLEGVLGEDAGMFKQILGSMGMNDKEFWKGAMVGAAAALILSNENVRKGIMGLVTNAGSMMKSGGETVKDTAVQTASSVKQSVTTGSEIFRDTVGAGKEGFKESVQRHRTQPEVDASEFEDEVQQEEMHHDLTPRKDNE